MDVKRLQTYKNLYLLVCMIVAGILGGGYFVSVSALLTVVLIGSLFYRIFAVKQITAAWDINMLAFAVLVFSCLLTGLWAVDPGMAPLGAVKFFPLWLFYIAVSGQQEERERIIELLPVLGSLMTLFSFLMMQFPVFEEWVSVAGRLAGFFQYPNTYALFMLICLIIVIWRYRGKETDWLDYLHGLAAVFGIIMSGSRTVFVLTGAVLLWLLIMRRILSRRMLLLLAAGCALAGVLVLAVGGMEVLGRFGDISLRSSTFLGRMLYVRDALPLILRYPFGMGYYGYYFIQQSVQTGVYSVVNVHNELLQIILDAGLIPAALMVYALLRSVFTRRTGQRNRVILTVILLHSLLDYDFQFLFMGFVLILFLDMRNIRTHRVPVLTKSVVSLAGAGMLLLSVSGGLSDLGYISGNYEMSLRAYSGNTAARLRFLTEAEDTQKLEETADAILEGDPYVSVAYSAKARALFAEGNVAGFIEYKEKALETAPYQFDEYKDYLDVLSYCEREYLADGNVEDARICAEHAAKIPEMLEAVKDRTSWLGWQINDKPQLTLPYDDMELIREMEELVNE